MGIHDRIINLCKERGISQSELERAIGIAKGSVTKWKKQEPRHSSIEKVASYFGVSADYIINGEKSETYYLNEETAKVAQEIFENKELRALFDATRDSDPEDLRALHNMALALKRKERGYDDDTGC